MAANTVLRLDSTTKTFAVDKAPPYAYTINYSDGSSADHQVRFFTPLLESGSQHYTYTQVNLTGAFEVNLKYYTTDASAGTIIGRDEDYRATQIMSNSSLRIRWVGGQVLTPANVVLVNKLQHLRMKRDSNDALTVFVDDMDNPVVTETGASGTFSFDRLGTYNDDLIMFDGYIADFKITNGSTLVIDSPIDKQYTAAAPTVINKADANNPLTAVNLNNAGQPFTLNALGTIWNGSDGTTTLGIA